VSRFVPLRRLLLQTLRNDGLQPGGRIGIPLWDPVRLFDGGIGGDRLRQFGHPKSSTFAWPAAVMKMFALLISRWTIPLPCAASSALAISTADARRSGPAPLVGGGK
jgi:hypothetical protein